MNGLTVLYVEDQRDDAFLLSTAIRRAKLAVQMQHVEDGDEAVRYLAGQGAYGERALFPVPALVLLDIQLPKRDGFHVLAWIRSQPKLVAMPVYIVSSSDMPRDVEHAKNLGADGYMVKTHDFKQVIEQIRSALGLPTSPAG